MNPGDTPVRRRKEQPLPSTLNQGRGVNPGDTRPLERHREHRRPALNQGRGVNPGDTWLWISSIRSTAPLNQGRGVNPGDTVRDDLRAFSPISAQPRPGREPRRHRGRGRRLTFRAAAQPRPGREPRRHLLWLK